MEDNDYTHLAQDEKAAKEERDRQRKAAEGGSVEPVKPATERGTTREDASAKPKK
jgi:hypothetical protein